MKAEFDRENAVILGVSADDLASHQRFDEKFQLRFPLLADVDRRVIEQYGAWGQRVRYGKTVTGILRTTFLVDRDGIVRKVYPNVSVEGHAEAILADLKTIQKQP